MPYLNGELCDGCVQPHRTHHATRGGYSGSEPNLSPPPLSQPLPVCPQMDPDQGIEESFKYISQSTVVRWKLGRLLARR